MPEYDVKLMVINILGKGKCPSEYKIGDEFTIGDPRLCAWAEHSCLPFAAALRFGGFVPWNKGRQRNHEYILSRRRQSGGIQTDKKPETRRDGN